MADIEELIAGLEKRIQDMQTAQLAPARQAAADKYGLPPTLAKRVQGATPEEIDADARALAASLAEHTGQAAPQSHAEQVEAVLGRIRGPLPGSKLASQAWDPDIHKRKGGGAAPMAR
jgi:hypothetical protein